MLGIRHSALLTLGKNIPVAHYGFTSLKRGIEIALLVKLLENKIRTMIWLQLNH